MTPASTQAAPRPRHVLPGFGLTIGTTLLYLAVIVLLPLAALLLKSTEIGFEGFWRLLTSPRTLASLQITVSAAALATLFNAGYGLLSFPANASSTR
jgi:sulfate transport system permease protein